MKRSEMLIQWDKFLTLYIIIVFSIVIVPLTNDRWQYIPMLMVMYASPLLLLFKLKQIKLQDWLLIGMASLMFLFLYRHPGSFRWSSYLYSCMFIMTYIVFKKALVNANIKKERLLNFFSFIIKAYAVVLFIQHLCVLFGLPVLNASYDGVNESGFKQGALSIEPSNTGPILTIILYVYIKLLETAKGRKIRFSALCNYDKWLILSYFYVCIGSLSVTCVLSLFVFLLYFIRVKHVLTALVGFLFLIAIISIIIPEVYDRVSTLLAVLLSFDPYLIYETDSSSSARIAPYLFYFIEFSLFDPNVWLGYGMDYGGLHVMGSLAGVDVDENKGMGGVINFMYDNGLIISLLLFIFIIKLCKIRSFTFLIYIILFSQVSFNHYMLWLFFIMVFTMNFYCQNDGMTCSNASTLSFRDK